MLPRRLAAFLLLAGLVGAACDGSVPTPDQASARPTPDAAASGAASPAMATPAAAFSPSPTPAASPSPTPAAAATEAATPRPSSAPATAGPPGPDDFWALVERGIRDTGRLEVAIDGPNAGTLRFEPDASATVIEGVTGYACVGRRAYDGQSGFARVPGTWRCGGPALVAGFRNLGQPIDAWNRTIPADRGRRESLAIKGDTWTWRYRATSPFYGGAVTASVTMDRGTRRITSAQRKDPTGTTRYTFRYGADFPPITIPKE
jgi:hypothetical protein